ncbi:lysozyme-like [Melitaea cinxia]|uniref:lysozyme-like n=1 Tax=Melitaea cinxia TaxID=113334 RepID=UPI001E27348D|nr:lysozyme-like [Melitaea cinxia]
MKLFVYSFVLFIVSCDCKVFTRCRLASELVKMKMIEKTFLSNWVCLIEKVSKRDTTALEIRNGKTFYGLYQIPNKWCREGKKGGDCNIACESLLDDNIRDDTACALRIFEQEGFKYWTQWEKRCKNDNHFTTEVYKCPDLLMVKTSQDGDLSSNDLREKRIVSRRGMERSRFLRSLRDLPWLRA